MIRYEGDFPEHRHHPAGDEMIPKGAVTISNNNVTLPPKPEVYSNIEALAGHFKLVFEGVKAPPGAWYDSFEAANGELGFYFVSDGSWPAVQVQGSSSLLLHDGRIPRDGRRRNDCRCRYQSGQHQYYWRRVGQMSDRSQQPDRNGKTVHLRCAEGCGT